LPSPPSPSAPSLHDALPIFPTLTRDLSVFIYETRPAFFDDPFFLRGKALYGKEVATLSDPARQEKTRNDKQAQAIKPALQQANKDRKSTRLNSSHQIISYAV